MAQFKDHNGKQWQVSLTMGSVARVHELSGINLSMMEFPIKQGDEMPLMSALKFDGLLLCKTLYYLVKPQADAANIVMAAFLDLFDDEVLVEADKAFWESVSFFFQKHRPKLMQLIEAQNRQIVIKTDKALKELSGQSPSDMQASPELNPGALLSVN